MRICACMIVKNESRVIGRCLKSLVGVVDRVVICDTGSTDGTEAAIVEAEKPPTEVHHRPWVSFAHNRNESLAYGRATGCDWLLVIDADNIACGAIPERDDIPADLDAFMIEIRSGKMSYLVQLLLRASAPWEYRGKIHEYLWLPTVAKVGTIASFWFNDQSDGGSARKHAGDFNPRWLDDIQVLEQAIADEPEGTKDESRYVFYLARTHDTIWQAWHKDQDKSDCAEIHRKRAIAAYTERILIGGWPQEVYYSLYRQACLTHFLPEKMGLLLQAWGTLPDRWEAALELMLVLQDQRMWEPSYAIGKRCLADPPAKTGIFLDVPTHEYELLFQFGVAAANVGFLDESRRAIEAVIGWPRTPELLRDAAKRNLEEIDSAAPLPAPPYDPALVAAPPI